MQDLRNSDRRQFLVSGSAVALAAAATTSTDARAAEAVATPPAQAFQAGDTPRPLPFDPAKLPGLSEKLLRSHWENNYGGSVKALAAVKKRLAQARGDKDMPPYVYNDLKREALIRTGSVVLHELHFDNLGGSGKAGAKERERWVKPTMVVEVAFGEWTPDGHIRHPVFRGVRMDKPGRAITREQARPVPKGTPIRKAPAKTSVKVTNADRVIDPSTGLKKIDLVRYYESIAEWMLPHLKGRPASLVRAPTGVTGQLLFPEARREQTAWPDPARRRPLAGSRCSTRRRHSPGVGFGCADERHRIPHLELARQEHQQTRSRDL